MEIVNSLWLGKLGHLEELTLNSFVRYGAEFHLWVYHPISCNVPGVIVRDGREIIPADKIFIYPPLMFDVPFGGSTYVGFSELFRYKVLHECGGWWTDMDVTCLKPLQNIENDYFFRSHGHLPVVGNIMKCPTKSELMRVCFEEAERTINDKTTDWHLGMKILGHFVKSLGLSAYVHDNACNVDRLWAIELLTKAGNKIPPDWMFVHWMNTVFDRWNFEEGSAFSDLLTFYRCAPRVISQL